MADGDGKLAVTGIIGTDPVPESGDDPSHFTQTDNASKSYFENPQQS